MPTSRKAAAAIRLLVLDVDGTLTDGRLYYGPRGEAMKVFHVRDGQGIKRLDAAGIHVAVISGRTSKMVAARCRELGVAHVIQVIYTFTRSFEHSLAFPDRVRQTLAEKGLDDPAGVAVLVKF